MYILINPFFHLILLFSHVEVGYTVGTMYIISDLVLDRVISKQTGQREGMEKFARRGTMLSQDHNGFHLRHQVVLGMV